MEVKLKWCNNAAFIGQSSGGHTVVMDGPEAGGGNNLGPRPMEMLLLGMGACSMYDIVSIIKKSKQQLISYEAKITAKRAEDYPKVFTDIYIYFTLCSENLKISTVKRAIELSSTKYCSASIMLGNTAKLSHDFTIIKPSD